ncbi:MAG: hypothetical protein FWG13_00845 [Leptospirales bacterium]|nr:hypothetical protein [Leptospirales bacterium]
MTSPFTPLQERLLDAIQSPLPLARRPFEVLEKELGIPESDIIDMTGALKKDGVIRNIAGIFDGERLGYNLSLVAFQISDENIEKAAAVINAHPGVSHNYLREHKYNLWFTIAENNAENLKRSVNKLASSSGALSHLIMKNERLIKIGFRLNMAGAHPQRTAAALQPNERHDLTRIEKNAVWLLQKDMPLCERPFQELSDKTDFSEDELIETASSLERKGVMRRYSAVLRHQKAGYNFNAMTAWKFTENPSDDIFKPFAESPSVTHLYIRTVYPGEWEYPLFAMIHARSENELNKIIDDLSKQSGLNDKLVLRSLKEFKKQKVIYFSPDFQKWKEENYD